MGREARTRKNRKNKGTEEVIFGTAEHLKDTIRTEKRLKALGLITPADDRPKFEIFYPGDEP